MAYLLAVLSVLLVIPPPATGVGAGGVMAALPSRVGGLRGGDVASYGPETIFTYLDGGAEVYLAYGMRECVARQYAGEATTLWLDLFDMGEATEAYGVFTHDQDGEPVAVGQGALLRSSWLSFWKGRFFVSIFAETENPTVRAAMLELGQSVAAAIVEEGELPEGVARLPVDGRVPQSVRYLHDPVVLSTHLQLDVAESLGLGRDTDVALARYARPGGEATLLLVAYPDESLARAAGVRLQSRGVTASAVGGRWLVLAVAPSTESVAAGLIGDALGRLEAPGEETGDGKP